MTKPTTKLLTMMLVFAAGQNAFAADLLAVYREASLQDAAYASAKAHYIAAQERLPQARYDLVVAQELVAQNDVEVKNRTLEQLVGKPVGKLAEADLADINAPLKDGAR